MEVIIYVWFRPEENTLQLVEIVSGDGFWSINFGIYFGQFQCRLVFSDVWLCLV